MKKKKSGILAKVVILLSFILAIFAGGYFFLDKLIVPKYFSQYGITGIGDLVDVVASLYTTPNESKMIVNGYTQTDLTNAISKLQKAGYKIESDGTIKEDNLNEFKGVGKIFQVNSADASNANHSYVQHSSFLHKSIHFRGIIVFFSIWIFFWI